MVVLVPKSPPHRCFKPDRHPVRTLPPSPYIQWNPSNSNQPPSQKKPLEIPTRNPKFSSRNQDRAGKKGKKEKEKKKSTEQNPDGQVRLTSQVSFREMKITTG